MISDVVVEKHGVSFVWDRGKAEANLRKHGVAFELASEIFFDPFVKLLSTRVLGGEERETAIGLTEGWSALVVAYTFRESAIRIISARPATARERKLYEDSAAP